MDIKGHFQIKKGARVSLGHPGPRRTAATYSPNWWVSTIGDGGLNCSVRNGERWNPAAMAAEYIAWRKPTRLRRISPAAIVLRTLPYASDALLYIFCPVATSAPCAQLPFSRNFSFT